MDSYELLLFHYCAILPYKGKKTRKICHVITLLNRAKIRTESGVTKWLNQTLILSGIMNPLFDGLTYNTSEHFAHLRVYYAYSATRKILTRIYICYSADTRTMNAKALFSLYLYFFITYFITFFRTSQSQPRGVATAETFSAFFPPKSVSNVAWDNKNAENKRKKRLCHCFGSRM